MKGDSDLKKKTKITVWCLLLGLFVTLIQQVGGGETYQAATSYTNAKEFYESTGLNGEYYHAEAAYGRVYYATKGKLASSSTNLKYNTIGFDITLSGNGTSVSFTVQKRGGSMAELPDVESGGYNYSFYVITEDKLFGLATKSDASRAAKVLSASTIKVRMDAIMTTVKGTVKQGGITEDGSGGFTYWGEIYRLKDSADLKAMKEIFSGHEFKSYKDIKQYVI